MMRCLFLPLSLSAAGIKFTSSVNNGMYLNDCYFARRIRSSTWQRLAELAMGEPLSMVLDRSMQRDPLWPILTPAHLQAIDRRLGIIASEVQRCTGTHGRQNVIFDTWP